MMPGEEMEITTDFGHPAYAEDIDIDLDFAVGHPDEDLELADFDQIQELQNFNSDTRDELMAEGDDASYGMVDADDVERNETAAASNDIEIDLGDPDENVWQQDARNGETFEHVDEIDYVDSADVGNGDVEHATSGEGDWLEAPAYPSDKPAGEDSGQVDVSVVGTSENSATQSTVPTGAVEAGLKVPEAREDGASHLNTPNNDRNDESGPEIAVQSTFDSYQDTTLQSHPEKPADEVAPSNHEGDEQVEGQSNGDVNQRDDAHKVDEEAQHLATEANEAQHDENISAFERQVSEPPTLSLPPGPARDQGSEEIEQEKIDEPKQDASEQQPDGELHYELANDKIPSPPENAQDQVFAPSPHETQSQPYASDLRAENSEKNLEEAHEEQEEHDQENLDENDETAGPNPKEGDPQTQEANVESLLSIAARHDMFISYGETDYRFFATSKDDDPNQYFLSNMSALELPLGQLLSSLRDVIADEVSPLDELVMHVDGLGLEFSESSACEILEEFTFGDILTLYDRLVTNDETQSPAALYIYLMVRPNCRQRLMALLDSADSGRGLSAIAVYREATPLDDEPVKQQISQASSLSADDGDLEEAYENDQENSVGVEFVDSNTTEARDEVKYDSPSTQHSVAETAAEDLKERIEEPNEVVGANVDENTADGLIDFSDEELDLSPATKDNADNTSLPNGTQDIHQYDPTATAEDTDSGRHAPPVDRGTDALHSDNTSATVTLNGDDQDEIDYSDEDDDAVTGGGEAPSTEGLGTSASLHVPIDDEITWESDNEDPKNEPPTAAKGTVQVSPTSGKRTRSDSDLLDGELEKNDIKRRRS
ncbi:hypothetical protein GGS23DRAFT_323519 [Durotheca rogersii]|uniref:uncharacterized protein n=1 Tax=Durotheca rogersii TaxID=419775 RepID=UPI00221F818A|nr:uncharacterized protein GGS23DRAFT_323519 [Durotheca rogersii]KAI5859346.1 hypothetical protein GGS23DRAFT_323519 [Durotheca rogersii]